MKRRPLNAVVLFFDETKLRFFPPLRAAWSFRGEQAHVRISGNNAHAYLFGALNPRTGHRLVLSRPRMRQADFQAFLRLLHSRYPGRELWLLLDRASCHQTKGSKALATKLGMKLIWLPSKCPELNAVDHLWRGLKKHIAANRQYQTLAEQIKAAISWVIKLNGREALRKAGTLSEQFWLKDCL